MHFSTISTQKNMPKDGSRLSPALALERTKRFGSVLGLVCLLGFSSMVPQAWGADAQESAPKQSPIVVTLKQFKVITDAKGDSKLGDASIVVPGDVVEYQATYSNRGASALVVTATLPVPEAMEYIKDSAKSKTGLVHTVAQKDSIFAQEPLLRKVIAAGGVTQTQTVPYADYRFVRWDLGRVQPNTSTEVSIRAKVSQSPADEATTGK